MTPPAATKRSDRWFRVFAAYCAWYLPRHFHRLLVAEAPVLPPDRPVIVYSNHPGWWDPLIYILLADRLFAGRPSYGPMDAAGLAQYPFLDRVGIFGIDTNSRAGAVQFLRTADQVLSNPAAMLWITAEGAFTDPRQRPLTLRSGIAHLARRHPGAILLPLAIEYPFWLQSKPEALMRFGAPLVASPDWSVVEWGQELTAALTTTLDHLAAQSIAREDAGFQPLLAGRAGVGGLYDMWRAGRAALSGRSFDPRHRLSTKQEPQP
ncbi:MAG: acyltransferase [Alphaproteobacteria bacterium]|nr:MAG: acyltransferase [Alphaproteobacteria bacterium]